MNSPPWLRGWPQIDLQSAWVPELPEPRNNDKKRCGSMAVNSRLLWEPNSLQKLRGSSTELDFHICFCPSWLKVMPSGDAGLLSVQPATPPTTPTPPTGDKEDEHAEQHHDDGHVPADPEVVCRAGRDVPAVYVCRAGRDVASSLSARCRSARSRRPDRWRKRQHTPPPPPRRHWRERPQKGWGNKGKGGRGIWLW